MGKKAVQSEVRRAALNMKTTERLRQHLEREAAKSGRVLTHEVEYRLERSFSEDQTYTTPTNAAILRDIGSLFKLVGFNSNARGSQTCREILVKAIDMIVEAHLCGSRQEKGLGAHLLGQSQSHSENHLSKQERTRLSDSVFSLTTAVINTSPLPDDGLPVASASIPFGFQPLSPVASALNLGPISTNKLSEE